MTFSYRTVYLSLIACGLLCTQSIPAFAQARYFNVRNDRFATVSSGPQSALVIDSMVGETDAAHQSRVRSVVQANWKRQAASLRSPLEVMRKSGFLKPRTTFAMSTVIMERNAGRLVNPVSATRAAGTRAFGGGELTFRYSGFSESDLAYIRPFVDLVYPRIKILYGNPAASAEVEIVNTGDSKSGSVSDVQLIAFGSYNASTNQILLPRYSNNDAALTLNQESIYPALLLNLIHAFHGPAVFQYDAWEQGMARAAAAVIARDPAVQNFVAANGATFFSQDPSANFFLSLLRLYEVLNQPALGNRTFFPPSQANTPLDGLETAGKMFLVRLGMSGAVWLKLHIENQQFFQKFNAEYYAQVSGNGNIAGDVPALRAMAGRQLPAGVEGIPFDDWFVRQYILDTSVSVGSKVYAFVIPGDAGDADNLQSALTILNYFNTKADGDETLLNGRAYATYLDSDNAPVQAGEGSAPVQDGEGRFTMNVFTDQTSGVGRYSLNFAVGGLVARTYLPIGFNTDFQGVVAGAGSLSGSVALQQVTLPPVSSRSGTTSINNGAFGRALGSPATDLSVTTVTLTSGGSTSTYRFNTGDGRYYAILRPQGVAMTVTRAFPQSSLPNLVSFPVRPFSPQPDVALGLPSTDFLLNTWDNPTGSYKAFAPGQASGSRLEPGNGYWLKVGGVSGSTVRMTGTAPPTDTDYTIAAPLGWSLIGSPFGTDINLSDISVQWLQNDPIPWDEAVGSYVQAQVYGFDPASQANGGYNTTDVLKGTEWKGYWIRTRVPGGVTLIVPGPDSPTRSQAVRSAITRSAGLPAVPTRSAAPRRNGRPEWSVRLTAEQSTGGPEFSNRGTATLGAAKDATRGVDPFWDQETPPAIVPGVQVSFTNPEAAATRSTGGNVVADYRDSATAGRAATWNLVVNTPVSGPATLRWDGVGTAPRRTRLTLVDTVSGARVPLRSRSSYTWTGDAGKTRAFQILSEPERSLPLAITNVNFQPVRTGDVTRGVGGNGVGLTYTIVGESDPQVTITIASPTGRVIRRMDGGTPSEVTRGTNPGANGAQQRSVRWDGRSQEGASVPMGTYLVTITARGQDGTVARVQRPILMIR
ncbi:MAG: hypothetical protein V4671_21050 [Armatimonadota bacterium]